MIQLGIKSDGSPYNRRLTARTRRLNLYNQDLVSVDLTMLAKAPNLESLELGRNPLRTLDLAPLAQCSHLEGLVATAEAPVDLAPLAACANLRWLHVYCQQWPALDLMPLAGLAHFESLYVNGTVLTALDLSPLAHCTTLRSFSLHCPAMRQVALSPLAACAQLETFSLEHTPVQELELFTWPNLQRLNLLRVPLETLDLTPLYNSKLKRFWFVEHTLAELDLTPLVGLETLDDVYFKPALRLLLDEVYVYHPERILSPGVRRYVDAGACLATGRFTRLKVLLHRLMQSPSPTATPYPTMDAATFWRLIEDARSAATGGGDMASELMRRLWSLPPETLKRFYDLFWYVMSLPGDDVHRTVYEVRGGCSDDDFLDFREWLLAQGQQIFYRVVNEPQVLRVWGEDGLGFEEGIVSMPLYQVCKARGVRV